MNILRTFQLTAVAAVLAGAMGMAHSAPCVLADVTYGVNGPPGTAADACVGPISGNIQASGAGAINDLQGFGGAEFVYADADNEASGSAYLGNFTFTLTAPLATSGVWTLMATDNNGGAAPNFPLLLDIALGLKGSSEYAMYFFNDVQFDGDGGGNFSMAFTAPNVNALSHMTAFLREGSSSSSGGTPGSAIPEPGTTTLALLGVAMIGAGLAGRRRKAAR